MHGSLTAALQSHQAGQLERAARLYRQVLACERDNADALHLLGVLHHQQGASARAVGLIERAVALRPNVAAFHANLAEALRARGDLERAVDSCRTALRLCPDFPEALCNLGLALQGLGRVEEAVESFRRALRLRPNFAAAHNSLGTLQRQLGQCDEALAHFRRAVELAPDHAPARTNLGQVLLERGQAEEALPHCREAVRLQPNVAALRHNLGNAFRALGRLVEARAEYLEALRLDARLAHSHAHLGLVLQQEGRLDEALLWLRQAVALAPDNPAFWEHLADLHDEREEFADAVGCRRRVLERAPGCVVSRLALSWSLQEGGQLAEAEDQYRAALRLEPASPSACLSLGGAHEERGRLAEAEAAFRAALRLQPDHAVAHARLAMLLRGGLPDADRRALEERLASSPLAPETRARLLFALAHVLDGRGEYGTAAGALREANALALDGARRSCDYSPGEHERFVTGLVRGFASDLFARAAGGGLDTRRPVFVFGLPRSGTTLIEQVLASHVCVHAAGELRLARLSFEAIPSTLGRPGPPTDCLPHLDAAAVRRLGQRHLGQLDVLAPAGVERVVDKMPDNYLYLGLLAAQFPWATFVHCRRDLRDVAVSCWLTDFRSIRWANDHEHIASRFRQYLRLMGHWKAVLPVQVFEVDYEEAVADLEGVARRLLAACGLEWDPACLEFYRARRPIRTASVTQVRRPVYQQSVGRWKNYEQELADLFARLPAR